MYKLIIAAALVAISTVSVANTAATDKNTGITSTRNLPVIIDNQMVAQGTCRLSFENGTSLEVPCNTDNKAPEAFASI